MLVLTYRDDELTREHPLQQLLGQASASGRVHRLPLRRLSEDAVRQLSATSRVDAGRVFAMTSGNPFFVAEVLAAGDGDRVPSTVADAVLARVRRLDPATQDALEQLAVVPSVVERWLVDALVAGGLAALAAAEEHGLLTVSPASVAFRHELARRAVADSVAGGAPGGAEPAGAPGAGRARGRRPVAHRPPRGSGRRQRTRSSAMGRRRPGRGRRRRPP